MYTNKSSLAHALNEGVERGLELREEVGHGIRLDVAEDDTVLRLREEQICLLENLGVGLTGFVVILLQGRADDTILTLVEGATTVDVFVCVERRGGGNFIVLEELRNFLVVRPVQVLADSCRLKWRYLRIER